MIFFCDGILVIIIHSLVYYAAIATQHNQQRLLKWYGFRSWIQFHGQLHRANVEAANFHRRYLLQNHSKHWNNALERIHARKISIAEFFSEQKLRRRFLLSWLGANHAILQRERTADRVFALRQSNYYLCLWRKHTRKEQQRMLHLQRLAAHFYLRYLTFLHTVSLNNYRASLL